MLLEIVFVLLFWQKVSAANKLNDGFYIKSDPFSWVHDVKVCQEPYQINPLEMSRVDHIEITGLTLNKMFRFKFSKSFT